MKQRYFLFGVMWILVLIGSILLSIGVGAKVIPLDQVFRALANHDNKDFVSLVIYERIPRTIFGILVGMGLAIAGVLMQSITRNPIADPSILGVNSGASLFVVFGIAFLGITTATEYIILAVMGAALSSILVYGLGNFGGGGTPIKLAIAGTAVSLAMNSLVSVIMMPRNYVVDQFRFWQVGSISGAEWTYLYYLIPIFSFCLISSFILAPFLDVLELGDEAATGLGARPKLIRGIGIGLGIILCGSITALAGPIGFIGLIIPHMMKMIFKGNNRIILFFSCFGGASLLLVADTIGRVLGRPGELEVGVVTAMLGAPLFIFIAMNTKMK